MHVIFIFFYEFFLFSWVFFDIRIEEELGDPRTILFSTSLIDFSFRGRTTDTLSLVQLQAKVLPTPPTLTKSISTQHFSTVSARSSESKRFNNRAWVWDVVFHSGHQAESITHFLHLKANFLHWPSTCRTFWLPLPFLLIWRCVDICDFSSWQRRALTITLSHTTP